MKKNKILSKNLKVLMLSLDRTLLGEKSGGDARERHQIYGQYVERLDIIIPTLKGFSSYQISSNVWAHPTNSYSKILYGFDLYQLGKKLFQEHNYHLLITQDFLAWIGYFLKRKLKIPLLVSCHSDFLDNPYWRKESWFNPFLELLIKFSLKRADGVRVVSRGIKEKVIKLGLSSEKIRVISTPVNLEKFEKFDQKKVREIKNQYLGKKIVLFVGRLVKAKGLDYFLKAISQIVHQESKVVFLFIGEGPERESLEKKIQALNLVQYVKLLGKKEHQELINYYHASDLFVLPSSNESFGKVLLEVAMAKKPAVATATTGAQEIIQDKKTGFLVPIGQPIELAQKILFLLKNDGLRKQMGQQAYLEIKERFSYQKNIQSLIQFWIWTANL